jgi:putative peptidoglycan lipid II flippase
VLRLYAPVALGITFSVIGIVLDRNLASRLSAEVIPTMRYATTLIQLPLGLVAAAVSFAVLPTLSRLAASNDDEAFRQTLALGIKVVIVLITPATVGLALLAEPLVALLYQRGAFGADDTTATARALWFYLPGLPAAAIDQMLLFAFYARQRTLLPNLVQGAAVGLYALTALVLVATTPWRIEALILGNTVQWIGHMALLALLVRPLVRLRGLQIGGTALRCAAASIPLAIIAWWLQAPLLAWGGPPAALLGAGGAAALAYLGAGVALRIEALTFVVDAIRTRGLRRGASRD